MQDVIEFINGRAYKKEELLEKGKYKVLRVGNFFTNDSWYYSNLELPDDKYCYNGDLLYAWSASFGPQIWDRDKTIFHYHIWNVKYNAKILFREYLYYFLLADKAKIKGSTTGSTMIHVSMENMKPRFLPIPPLEEQKRIVAKIQELLPIVDVFANCQNRLNTLNENIKPLLRKSILQEAIQGKLVPQDPADEPASVLLERIKEEKQRLLKEGKLKKKDVVDSVIFKSDDNRYYEQIGKDVVDITDEIPFDVPDSWEWIRFGNLIKMNIGKTPPRGDSQYWSNGIYPWVSISDMNDYGLIGSTKEKISLLASEKIMGEISPIGTLLMSFKLTVGKTSILNVEAFHNEAIISIYPYIDKDFATRDYLFYILPLISNLGESKDAIKGKTLNSKSLFNLLVPLPSINEQNRIVRKIEELYALL